MIEPSFWKGKKVFLTGHTGFKGSWLSIWLNHLGANVLGYALQPDTIPSLFDLASVNSLVESVTGDIRDLKYLKETMMKFEPDIVIHMAAQPLVRTSYENPVETYETNVMGTVNVLESVRFSKSVKAILNITTDKVYENKEWFWGYRETDALGGFDPYSNSKACAELVTSSYIQSFFNTKDYKEHGVAVATARAGNVIGGGDWATDRLIPDIIKSIHKDTEIVLRNPQATRPWQHVLEPLSGYLILCEKLYTDGTSFNGSWNFGPLKDSKSVEWIAKSMIKKFESYSIVNTQENGKLHEANFLELDCSKALKLLKWAPKLTIDDALAYTVQWHQDYLKGTPVKEVTLKQIRDYYGN